VFVALFGLATSLAQQSPRELRQEAMQRLNRGEFMDAIPYLQQLIEYLGDSKERRIITSMEMVYYNLGISHFFVGQFDEAKKTFDVYLKKHRHGSQRRKAAVYAADSLRFKGKHTEAIKAYRRCLRDYAYGRDLETDIYSSMARCLLAQGEWHEAVKPLMRVYRRAPDFLRQNWAATLLTAAYFKDLDIEKIYPIMPYLLRPNSLASRSVAFNISALEAGDELFADERYRDALWVFRMVYPHDTVLVRSEEYLEYLRRQAEKLKSIPGDPRPLMRIQESIAEMEEEVKILEGLENYDLELFTRIARGYMELMRYWEGREIFLYLHDVAEGDEAEEALFLAFRCSSQIQPWTRAYEIGSQYMTEYPSGEFYDTLTLVMGQMYARERNWPAVISHLTKALEDSPNHQSGAECMLLIGYASFMEEKFADAVDWLLRMRSRYPDNDLQDEATYWTAMALLFDRKYEEAAREFDLVLEDYPDSIYVEDASFRRAVCDYGQALYEASAQRLSAFAAVYPESRLTGEALVMLADAQGALGALANAVKHYQDAMKHDDLNIELYNHSAFQCGRILAEDEEYARLRDHFQQYINKAREGSNIPLAVYWVGIALWNSGEPEGAVRYYRAAVEEYGRDRTQVGIDLILDEWVGRIKRSTPEQAKLAWRELREAAAGAEKKHPALALRLKRVIVYDPDIKPTEKQRITNELMSRQNVSLASPAVLQAMLDTAKAKGNKEFAVAVANEIVGTFTETDYALDARMVLADFAIEEARRAKARHEANAHYAEAIKHLGVIREVFATSSEAAQALILLGQLYRTQKKFESADACYTSVLGVKGWRNFWPEALHGRGECAYLQKRYDVASAYYERIYLMYSHYTPWAAKAYLRRAECLKRTYRKEKAREVLKEMLANSDLAAFPETETARGLLKKLGQGS